MKISAADVAKLRKRTDAPMMDCKRALEAAKGDPEAAYEALRKGGQAKADKKADRVAAEGLISIAANDENTMAAMLETNCETDFVARDSNFVAFCENVAELALKEQISDRDSLVNAKLEDGTVDAQRTELIAKVGENINVRRIAFATTEEGCLGTYVHGGRIGVVVHLKGGDAELAKDLAMHIAANNPQVVSPDEVPPALIEKEKEIYTAQAQESGKPAEIIEKMITGRIKKFCGEVSLLGQPFVKDPNTTVENLLKSKKAQVESFVRFEVGEGIEKKKDDFVKEVMEQVQGSNA